MPRQPQPTPIARDQTAIDAPFEVIGAETRHTSNYVTLALAESSSQDDVRALAALASIYTTPILPTRVRYHRLSIARLMLNFLALFVLAACSLGLLRLPESEPGTQPQPA